MMSLLGELVAVCGTQGTPPGRADRAPGRCRAGGGLAWQ